MEKNDNTRLYQEMPAGRAILTLALPTVISQLITVFYNMADTFFIGQMNDPRQVAAATVATPLFVLLTAIANLFGIGGSSLISRSLGQGDRERARHCAAFSLWGAAAAAVLYGLAVLALCPVVLPLFGTTEETYALCRRYLLWTVSAGGLPTVLSAAAAHLIRAEGGSRQAGFGIAMGGLLNVALDPLFIFAFRLEIAGAAIATMLSNLAALGYYLLVLCRNRDGSAVTLDIRYFTLGDGIPQEVAAVGLPSFMMTLMGTVSNVVLNKLVSGYSSEAVAGMGIAKKIDTLAFAIATGMTQGVLSLTGYNYASGNLGRMREVIRLTFLYTLAIALAGTAFLFTCAAPVARFFIDSPETVAYGQYFLRVICLTCPTVSVTFIAITSFQAMGQKKQPMFLSLLRKGGCDIPFMFLFNRFFGFYGIAWATPVSDLLSMAAALCLFLPFLRRLRREEQRDR